jgi:hypothetical protein
LLARPAPASVGEKWADGCLLSVGIGNQGERNGSRAMPSAPSPPSPASIGREALPPTRLQPCSSGTTGSNRSVSRRAFWERRCAPLFAPLPDAEIVGYLRMASRCRRPSTPHPSPPHFLITQPMPRQTKKQLGSRPPAASVRRQLPAAMREFSWKPGQSGNPTGQTAIGGPLRSGNGAKVGTSEAPPDERDGNRNVRPTATAPHSDSTTFGRPTSQG